MKQNGWELCSCPSHSRLRTFVGLPIERYAAIRMIAETIDERPGGNGS